MNRDTKQSTPISRLTALWALSESGLGGFMHALGLPFTGFFVGGFAVVIVGLLAWYGGNNLRTILQATVLVILVKATVSPQSPPPAYIAVAFQGLIGAVLYRIIPSFGLASVIFGVIAMLESALQKLITATIIFGNSIWEAVDSFFKDILKDLHLPADTSYSLWIIVAYSLVYAVWGLVLGIWIRRLPEKIESQKELISRQLKELRDTSSPDPDVMVKTGLSKIWLPVAVLIFIILVTMLSPDQGYTKALRIIIRTLGVLAFFIWVINPFIRWLLRKMGSKYHSRMQDIVSMLPELRNYIRPALALARVRTGYSRLTRFVLVLIVLTLHPETYEQ